MKATLQKHGTRFSFNGGRPDLHYFQFDVPRYKSFVRPSFASTSVLTSIPRSRDASCEEPNHECFDIKAIETLAAS